MTSSVVALERVGLVRLAGASAALSRGVAAGREATLLVGSAATSAFEHQAPVTDPDVVACGVVCGAMIGVACGTVAVVAATSIAVFRAVQRLREPLAE